MQSSPGQSNPDFKLQIRIRPWRGWYRIGQQFLDDPDRIVDLVGTPISQQNTTYGIRIGADGVQRFSEGGTIFVWNAGVTVPIGKPFGQDVELIKSRVESGDFAWSWHRFEGNTPGPFPIRFEIPEPSGFVLATLALAALVASERRASGWRRLKPRSPKRDNSAAL